MKNLFDPGVVDEIHHRINQLSNTSSSQWGKMNVAQMLAHCVKPMEMALGEIPVTKAGFFKRIIGRMIKSVVTSPKPYKQGLPTDPTFVTISTEYDFNQSKERLITMLNRYMQQQNNVANIPHPFFGKLTKEECGMSQFKHLDHHLRQFGA